MKQDIKVYTSPSCIHCQKLKEWLKENSIEYTEKSIDKNPKYQLDLLNFKALGLPFTIIKTIEKDKLVKILGFNEKKLTKALLEN